MMAIKTLCIAAILVALCEKEATGFSVSPRLRVTTTSLNVGGSLNLSDEDAALLMQHARECATSDSCSVTDAKSYLQEIMQVQSDPAASADAMEIVAKLQAKIRHETATAMSQGILSSSLVSPQTPMVLSLGVILYFILVHPFLVQDAESVPLTFQEWWWAARDGYLTTMFAHYIRNGGL